MHSQTRRLWVDSEPGQPTRRDASSGADPIPSRVHWPHPPLPMLSLFHKHALQDNTISFSTGSLHYA